MHTWRVQPYENFERLSYGIDDDYRSAVLMLQDEKSCSIAWAEISYTRGCRSDTET